MDFNDDIYLKYNFPYHGKAMGKLFKILPQASGYHPIDFDWKISNIKILTKANSSLKEETPSNIFGLKIEMKNSRTGRKRT